MRRWRRLRDLLKDERETTSETLAGFGNMPKDLQNKIVDFIPPGRLYLGQDGILALRGGGFETRRQRQIRQYNEFKAKLRQKAEAYRRMIVATGVYILPSVVTIISMVQNAQRLFRLAEEETYNDLIRNVNGVDRDTLIANAQFTVDFFTGAPNGTTEYNILQIGLEALRLLNATQQTTVFPAGQRKRRSRRSSRRRKTRKTRSRRRRKR